MFIDYLYIILVVPMLIVALIAQLNVKLTYSRYSRETTRSGMTGYDSARMVLDANGLTYVQINMIEGQLTDHFDPRTNVINLSRDVYEGQSAAAVGVAAHEAGHAVQYAEEYAPMRLRAFIIPATNIGAQLSFPLLLLGLLFSFPPLAYAGVIAFGLSTFFQLVTLPVEFNASHRALIALTDSGRFEEEELKGSRRVLRAAALTYVAALAVSFANLLRLLIIAGGSRRRR